MPDYPRMTGLRQAPVEDQDTIVIEKKGKTIPPKYSFDRPKRQYFWKNYSCMGSGDERIILQAKEYYKKMGLAVRVVKHEAKSYGVYYTIYVGTGKWHESVR